MKTALTIAGYDPSSGAGVTADLMVFAAHGLFGTSCITALTVQSTLGVRSTSAVDASLMAEMLECLGEDLPPDGIKIGMIGSGINALEISKYIASMNVVDSMRHIPIILDPVLQASSGCSLTSEGGLAALRDHLIPLVSWITPNVDELARLTGKVVESLDDVPSACRSLQQFAENKGSRARLGVFAKGGHLLKPNDYLLTPEGDGQWLAGERVETRATHGTGCALSSAFLSQLILGQEPVEAARRAKAYVAGALRNAVVIGHGPCPINHLWNITK